MGNALRDLGHWEAAARRFGDAVARAPEMAEAHNNLGAALNHLGQPTDAAASLATALELQPGMATAHCNLGIARQTLGDTAAAGGHYRDALDIDPGYADAHHNLGNLHFDAGRHEEAAACYQRALTAEPGHADAPFGLAEAFRALRRFDDAGAAYERALARRPDAAAHNNLGIVLKETGRIEDALAHYRAALDLDPGFAAAENNLGVAMQDLGRPEKAIRHYRRALDMDPGFADAGRNILYAMMNVPGLSPPELFDEHLDFAARHAVPAGKAPTPFANDPSPERMLRVGYLSSDFRDHAVGTTLMPLIRAHDRKAFEIFCYADLPRPDAVSAEFQTRADGWRNIAGRPDAEVAALVRADGIDLLVLLAGRFDDNRPLVAAHRAAPVQVSLYDAATSGLAAMDAKLTDGFLTPPDGAEQFTETPYRLPVLYQCLPIADAPAVAPPPAARTGRITFGSFNAPAKINPGVIALWSRVLNAVPGARLVLKYKNLYAQPAYREPVAAEFRKLGVDAERIEFRASRDSRAGHLGHYADSDIALDTFPCTGVTTTFQALWMGVPVVTRLGDTLVRRTAGSLLHHVGLDDLIAATEDAYVATARDLAGDPAGLAALRAGLRARVAASPLCDAPAYARSIETAYRELWRRWCAADAP